MGRPSQLLRGKVAVVTGSTRGIGLMIAAAFAQAGAQIAICAPRMESVEAVYQQLAEIPGIEVLGAACDVRRREEVEELATQTVNRFGAIDIWVNNAAIAGPLARTAELPVELWQEVIDTNLTGTFHGTQIALQQMLPRNQGKIINLVGEGPGGGALLSAYAASKAAVLRLTEVTAEEYRDRNLSILALAPGSRRDGLLDRAVPLSEGAEPRARALREEVERSAIELEEIGELAVRLASRETDGVTGKLYEARAGLGQALRGLFGRR